MKLDLRRTCRLRMCPFTGAGNLNWISCKRVGAMGQGTLQPRRDVRFRRRCRDCVVRWGLGTKVVGCSRSRSRSAS